MLRSATICLLLLGGFLLSACDAPTPQDSMMPDTTATATTLKDAFEGAFLVGAALNPEQFFERDSSGAALIKTHFNTITPENVMKWIEIHPAPGEYDFEAADQFVEFGEANDMFIVGHTLVWHSQIPDWVFEDDAGSPVNRDTLLARMRDHIFTVVGRYKGRVDGWDVVNEALNEDGTLRESRWMQIIGEDYLAKAFEYAHEADPDAELYYNDYSLENAPKRNGAVRLVQNLLDQGLTVTGIGSQGHNNLTWPSPAQQDSTIQAFADLGVKVMITELDVDVLPRRTQQQTADVSLRENSSEDLNPYADALPDSLQQALANRYADLFEIYLKHRDAVSRVTFWGVMDGDSWKNNWPIPGRTNYPLLFDRDYQPKPAFDAVVQTVEE